MGGTEPAAGLSLQLRAAFAAHREQVPTRIGDLLEPLVTRGHSHRELAPVDGELAGKSEQLVAQSLLLEAGTRGMCGFRGLRPAAEELRYH